VLKEKGKIQTVEDEHTIKPDETPDGDILIKIINNTFQLFYVENHKKYIVITCNFGRGKEDEFSHLQKYYRGNYICFIIWHKFVILYNKITKQIIHQSPADVKNFSNHNMNHFWYSTLNKDTLNKYYQIENAFIDLDTETVVEKIKKVNGLNDSTNPIFHKSLVYFPGSYYVNYTNEKFEYTPVLKLYIENNSYNIRKQINLPKRHITIHYSYLYTGKDINKGIEEYHIGGVIESKDKIYDEDLNEIEKPIGPVEKISDTLFLAGGCLFKIRQKEEKKTIKCKKCGIHMGEYEVVIFPCKCKDICLQCSRALSECIICKYTIDHVLEI
jgi:hypothetical protein